MKKHQIKTLAILAAIAVILGILLALLSYDPSAKLLPSLVEISARDIDQLVFDSNTANINLQLQQGQWQLLLKDVTIPANQELVRTIIEQLCDVRPQQQLEELDPDLMPMIVRQATIEILSGTGTEQVNAHQQIIIGSMNAVTDQLYVQIGEKLYLTDTALMKIFPASELELAQQDEIPRPENQNRVQVNNFRGTVLLSCVGSETGGQDGTWYVQTADGWVQADQSLAYNFYFLTWDMHWKATVDCISQESQLAAYGLDNPQVRYTLTYGNETFDLILGNNLPDGTTYAMRVGSPLVYTMDSLLADWLAQATAESALPQS